MLTENEKKILETYIYNIAKKFLNENKNFIVEYEKEKEKNEPNETNNDNVNNKRRRIVIKWLKDPIVDNAPIMKQLWNPTKDEEDSKRSYFYKCRDGELNDNGVPYQFSDSEINTLYKIKNNGTVR